MGLSIEFLKSKLIECFYKTNSIYVVKPGDKCFKLSHGDYSPYYIDVRNVILTQPECLRIIGELIVEKIKNINIDVIVGKGYGAYPLCIIVSQLINKPVLIIRDKPKNHGLKGKFIGNPDIVKNRNVLILDDVITTGSTIFEIINEVESLEGKVVKIIIIVDRLEGGLEKVKEKGYDIEALINRIDLGITNELIQELNSLCIEKS